MNLENVISRLTRLISIKSLSGFELDALKAFEEIADPLKLNKERINISENRYDLFYSTGTPKIVFTAHIDVVNGEDHLFLPKCNDTHLFGRGACDTKGSLIAMLEAVEKLLAENKSNFGLLVVVGEEDDGIGAKIASETLRNRGIDFLINGEPTENCLAENSGGAFDAIFKFTGKAAHSGYPEFGDDANKKLLNTCFSISNIKTCELERVGISSINLGKINGGDSGSIVSPYSELRACIRTTSISNSEAISLISSCIDRGTLDVPFNCPYVNLFTLPCFKKTKIYFASDIPNFKNLNCRYLMYGPGNILDAHTNYEKVEILQLQTAVCDYVTIYNELGTLM